VGQLHLELLALADVADRHHGGAHVRVGPQVVHDRLGVQPAAGEAAQAQLEPAADAGAGEHVGQAGLDAEQVVGVAQVLEAAPDQGSGG
jgi:hypothetical protein